MNPAERIALAILGAVCLGLIGIGLTDGTIGLAPAFLMGVAVAIGVYGLYDRLLPQTLLEVLIALLPLVGAAAVFVGYVILPLDEEMFPRGPLVIATGVSVGWIATWFTAEYRRARERRQGSRDLAIAIRSEVYAAVQTLDSANWDDQHQTFQDKLEKARAKGKKYEPITLSESPPIVFQALSGSLDLLPEETVTALVEYYASQTDLQTLAGDVQKYGGAETEKRLRIGLHHRITETRKKTLQRGLQAIYCLNVFLGDPEPAGSDALPRTGHNPDIGIKK